LSSLFTPLSIRGTTFRNRAWVSPMCQYSAVNGLLTDWHFVHLGALASGGTGLIISESTGVTPTGRISPQCTGIWSGEQTDRWARVVRYVQAQGTPIGIQLAHAGRKASTSTPWTGEVQVALADGGWQTIAPSPVPFGDLPVPTEMSHDDIESVRTAFVAAAQRALEAGFDVVELHAAHGYLMHEFLSPLTNFRRDAYGGSYEGRMRFPLELVTAVRDVWPDNRPLFVRISTTDWMPGGWDLESSIGFSKRLAEAGVDLVDCSSGGLLPDVQIPEHSSYQVEMSRAIREGATILTAAVGRITDPRQAEAIVAVGDADAVFLGREMLRDPHWPLRAAHALGAQVSWPPQYQRAQLSHRTAQRAEEGQA
jgi:2,4-dienoyl-CoA reductase-like NADH-dependent reductase (Old Yellow Enzyme family)